MTIHNQNTNWYRTDDGQGWTANPEYAKSGEVDKRGLHDCSLFGCKERHGASAEEYADNRVRKAQSTQESNN